VLFNSVGIPGFQFIQDPLDYGIRCLEQGWEVDIIPLR
jgi:hypothetical protein